MTAELFEELTGFDPNQWVATKRTKHYANGQYMEYDGKRVLLEGFTKRCNPIAGDLFDDKKLECVRVYKGSTSYYTFYLDGDVLKADMTSASAWQRYQDQGYSEEDAYKYASSTYFFEEKQTGLDVIEGVDMQWELVSIDENTFKIVNNSKIDGEDYREMNDFRFIIQVAPKELPMMDGLLVLTNGVKALPTFRMNNELVFTTRYDIKADAYICEIEDEELEVTMTVGSPREMEQISAKLTRDENGWSWEPISTPLTHRWGKRKFIRISDFRNAGLI